MKNLGKPYKIYLFAFTDQKFTSWVSRSENLFLSTVSVKDTTIMILNFWTDRSGQTVQTQIRLSREQSDQGLHCLLFNWHVFDKYPHVSPLVSILGELQQRFLHP